MQRPLSFPTYFACSAMVAAGVTLSHELVSHSLDYASYWWTNTLYWPGADWTLQALFLLLPLPAVFACSLAMRKLAWFPWVAVGALFAHGTVRLIDAGAGAPGTGMLIIDSLPSDWYWLLPALLYGVVAGVGAALGLAAASILPRRAHPVRKTL